MQKLFSALICTLLLSFSSCCLAKYEVVNIVPRGSCEAIAVKPDVVGLELKREQNASESRNYQYRVLELVNEERAKVGARPLRMSYDLLQAANVRAQELVVRFSHTRPNGTRCFSILSELGNSWGENIAGGQVEPEEVVECWMTSQGHRENILNPRFRELGVGYHYDADSEYEHFWVQLFRG